MVTLNTNSIIFKHFVDVPSSDCVIATAMDAGKKLKLYLIVNGNGPIYKRNGLADTWDQLEPEQYEALRQLVKDAMADHRVPHYSTDSLSVLN